MIFAYIALGLLIAGLAAGQILLVLISFAIAAICWVHQEAAELRAASRELGKYPEYRY